VTSLSERLDVAYVFVFENSGRDIGVTLQHPHGQIYGYPFVPQRIRTGLEAARRHRDEKSECLSCALLDDALATRARVVLETEHLVAYVPAAARWPYEVHVVPRRHLPDLAALGEAERDSAMEVYADLLRRFDALFPEETAYIAAWQQAPVRTDRDLAHVNLQLFTTRRAPGKLKYLAGSESALGVFVNDIVPEDGAARLRELGSG
jgi:UDPglucose--hexose-1-phosphate uridylyltransferase